LPRPLSTHELSIAALFSALLAASAFVTIPVGPVPFTLQVFVVLLAGIVLGPRLGPLSVLGYLMLGLIAPVYSNGVSGLAGLFGPTGGYLWGFLATTWLTGLIARPPGSHRAAAAPDIESLQPPPNTLPSTNIPRLPRLLLAGAFGLAPMYTLGTVWLGLQLELEAKAAVAAGITPFLACDLLKAVMAALAARALVELPVNLPSLSPPPDP